MNTLRCLELFHFLLNEVQSSKVNFYYDERFNFSCNNKYLLNRKKVLESVHTKCKCFIRSIKSFMAGASTNHVENRLESRLQQISERK